MKENKLRVHEDNSSILSGRAGAEQQLATSYLWFAIFLLISPSFSVLSLPLSSQLFLALPSFLALVDSRLQHFHHQLDPENCSHCGCRQDDDPIYRMPWSRYIHYI